MPAEANALLADSRASILALKPAYQRVIAWAQGELPTAPERPRRRGLAPGRRRLVRRCAEDQHDARPDGRPGASDRAHGSDPDRRGAGRARPPVRLQGPQRLLRRPRQALPAEAVDRCAARRLSQARQRRCRAQPLPTSGTIQQPAPVPRRSGARAFVQRGGGRRGPCRGAEPGRHPPWPRLRAHARQDRRPRRRSPT